jgi:hypothetical protein
VLEAVVFLCARATLGNIAVIARIPVINAVIIIPMVTAEAIDVLLILPLRRSMKSRVDIYVYRKQAMIRFTG